MHPAAEDLDRRAARHAALGDPARLGIVDRLGLGDLSPTELQDALGISSNLLAHHLKTLVTVGLVTQERESTTLICRANYAVMHGLIGYLVNECCADGACLPGFERTATKT